MIRYIVVLALAVLSGCYQTVNELDLIAAEKYCASKGSSTFEISAYFDGGERVVCKDRSENKL